MSFAKATFSFSQATMEGAALLCTLSLLSPTFQASNAIGAAVNSIAYIHYTRMLRLVEEGVDVTYVRFSDWLATVPLMVVEMHSTMGASLLDALPSTIFAALMIVTGGWAYLQQQNEKDASGAVLLSFLCLLGVWGFGIRSLIVTQASGYDLIIPIVFCVPWFLYGIAFVMKAPNWIYNLLDVYSKCGLAITTSLLAISD